MRVRVRAVRRQREGEGAGARQNSERRHLGTEECWMHDGREALGATLDNYNAKGEGFMISLEA